MAPRPGPRRRTFSFTFALGVGGGTGVLAAESRAAFDLWPVPELGFGVEVSAGATGFSDRYSLTALRGKLAYRHFFSPALSLTATAALGVAHLVHARTSKKACPSVDSGPPECWYDTLPEYTSTEKSDRSVVSPAFALGLHYHFESGLELGGAVYADVAGAAVLVVPMVEFGSEF